MVAKDDCKKHCALRYQSYFTPKQLIRYKKSKIQIVWSSWETSQFHKSSACLGMRRPRKTNTIGSLETEEPLGSCWGRVSSDKAAGELRGCKYIPKKVGKQLNRILGTLGECEVTGTSEGYLARNSKQQQNRAMATEPKGVSWGLIRNVTL